MAHNQTVAQLPVALISSARPERSGPPVEQSAALEGLLRGSEAERAAAWPAFVEEFSFLLLHVARSVAANRDEAMDAYAVILEELSRDDFRRLRGYSAEPRSKFTTWLVVVARRICVDLHRARYGRRRESDSPARAENRRLRRQLEDLASADMDLATVPDESRGLPDQELIRAEASGTLLLVTGRLAAEDRLLLKLRFEDGMSASEIARIVRASSQFQVYRRINALLAELRQALVALGVEGPAA